MHRQCWMSLKKLRTITRAVPQKFLIPSHVEIRCSFSGIPFHWDFLKCFCNFALMKALHDLSMSGVICRRTSPLLSLTPL